MYTINSIYLHDYIFYQMTMRLSTENDSFLIKVLEKPLKNPYFERRFRENNEINIIFGRESSFFRQLESLGASEGENSHFVNREYAVKQGDEDWCEGNSDE